MAVILGIDPGSRKTGFGIINHVSGRSEYITSGVIRLPAGELAERLRIIYHSVTELVQLHCPAQLAIEQVFMAKSAGSARRAARRLSPVLPMISRSPSTQRDRSSRRWWAPARPIKPRCSTW